MLNITLYKKVFQIKGVFFGKTAQKGYISIFDQALVSATKFFIALILARYTHPSHYGIYVMAFAVFIFVNNIQMSYF